MLRLLSLLFHLLRKIAPAEWLVVILLLWWGYIRGLSDPWTGRIIWSAAGLLALLSMLGRALDHMIFLPAPRSARSAVADRPLTAIVYGYASGNVRARLVDFFDVEVGMVVHDLPVQIRWLGEQRPPHLAVLAPRDLRSSARNPTPEAEVWSLWYPGSKVRTGWIYVAGRQRYGLELSFLGKRLLLALEDEEAAEQIQGLIETA